MVFSTELSFSTQAKKESPVKNIVEFNVSFRK
jgi:hypothetical protein